MSRTTSRRTPRRAAGLAAAFALGVSTLGAAALGGLATAPASAAPAEDCADAVPVSGVSAGTVLHGLTVTSGTTPVAFNASVVGLFADGIAPGVPLLVVKVDPSTFTADPTFDPTEVKGIWEGMSGSPLYTDVAHTHLVGAISYALANTTSWVAGVTPFEDMTSYRGTGSSTHRVHLDARTRRAVVASSGATASQVDQGFRSLPLIRGVSGVPSSALNPTARQLSRHSWLPTGARPIGQVAASGADTLDPSADTVIAGGNLAVSLSYGDVAFAGIGTATSVCDNEVVGFGHPMNFGGESTLALHSATALYVQGSWPSFKMANLGPVVGTVFGDHMTGVTGKFGAGPSTATITSALTYGSRSRTGTTHVADRMPGTLAAISYYETAANGARVLDGQFPGSMVLTWTIAGDDNGQHFSMAWTDRYRGSMSVADEVGFRLGDLMDTFANMPGVTIDSLATTGTATRSTTAFTLTRIEQRRGGKWIAVTDRAPALATAGRPLQVRAVLKAGGVTVAVPLTLNVPKKTSGRVVDLMMIGGGDTGLDLGSTPATALAAIHHALRSDEVLAIFGKITGVPSSGGGGDFEGDFRASAKAKRPTFTLRATSAPVAGIVNGTTRVPVLIR